MVGKKVQRLVLWALAICLAVLPGVAQAAQEPLSQQATISFIDISPSPEREAMYQGFIEAFKAVEPNITVEYESVPWDDAHNKLVMLAATNSLPDVIQVHYTWISEFVGGGWVADLAPYLESYEYKDSFTNYASGVLLKNNQMDVYGGVYFIPDAVLNTGILYRKDYFAEAGIEPNPQWTLDEFVETAAKLTDPSKNRYGLAYRGARGGFDQISWNLFAANEGKMFDDAGKCLFDSEPAIEAFEKYTSIYLNGYAPKDAISWGFAEMLQGFSNGSCAMLMQNPDAVPVIAKGMDMENVGFLPLPRNDKGDYYSEAAPSYCYGVAATSENQEAAWRFVGFCSSPENNITYCKTTGLIPVMKEALEDPYFAEGVTGGFMEALDDPGFVVPALWGYYPELGSIRETMMDAEVQKYLQGNQTAAEAMGHLAAAITEAQQKYMQENPDVPIPQPIVVRNVGKAE